MSQVIIKYVNGLQPYEPIWHAMRQLTAQRIQAPQARPDEIWLLEHQPVFTQGQAGKPEHVLNPHQIPVVNTDRGGQVTYHGPGQLMVYTLLNLTGLGLRTREYVRKLEQIIVKFLRQYGITGESKPEAPGVYVNNAKIASIGLRVRHGFSYHGLAFNIQMDLTPFQYINPCGFKNLAMTQLSHFVPIKYPAPRGGVFSHMNFPHCERVRGKPRGMGEITHDEVIATMKNLLIDEFGYTEWQFLNTTQMELIDYEQTTIL